MNQSSHDDPIVEYLKYIYELFVFHLYHDQDQPLKQILWMNEIK